MIWLHGEKKAVIQPGSPLIDVVPDDTPWLRGPAGVDDIPSDWGSHYWARLESIVKRKSEPLLSLRAGPFSFWHVQPVQTVISRTEQERRGELIHERIPLLKAKMWVKKRRSGGWGWGVGDKKKQKNNCVVDDMKNAAGFYGPYLTCVGTPCHNNRGTAPAFSVIP